MSKQQSAGSAPPLPAEQARQIRFDDGAAYEEFMGKWSRLAGDAFLHWLDPASAWRWVDVGCGNGAFTEMLVERCAPVAVRGIDPSAEQVAYARQRLATDSVRFDVGDAMALPYADTSFDAAVMALVIFFVPDPARSVAEMARVVRPGGSVSSYAWDILGGGFPYDMLQDEMSKLAVTPLWPPSVEASRMETMRSLWSGAGLTRIETHEITVERTFPDFDAFWRIAQTGPRLAASLAAMLAGDRQILRDRLQARLPANADGRITCRASANAIKGKVPA
jgi:ubiquinone/menaquinone biosynthesis C-methylase UbiE